MTQTIDPKLQRDAIAFLRRNLVDQEAIADTIQREGPTWYAGYHFGWGSKVRNLLRDNGFGEKELGVENLDDVYVKLVEEAVWKPRFLNGHELVTSFALQFGISLDKVTEFAKELALPECREGWIEKLENWRSYGTVDYFDPFDPFDSGKNSGNSA